MGFNLLNNDYLRRVILKLFLWNICLNVQYSLLVFACVSKSNILLFSATPCGQFNLNSKDAGADCIWITWTNFRVTLSVVMKEFYTKAEVSEGAEKWGRSLEDCPARRPAWLVGGEWPSRAWFCTWWTVHVVRPDGPHHLSRSWADLLLNVH